MVFVRLRHVTSVSFGFCLFFSALLLVYLSSVVISIIGFKLKKKKLNDSKHRSIDRSKIIRFHQVFGPSLHIIYKLFSVITFWCVVDNAACINIHLYYMVHVKRMFHFFFVSFTLTLLSLSPTSIYFLFVYVNFQWNKNERQKKIK